MQNSRFIILLVLTIILIATTQAKTFSGNATIKIINPSSTIIAVCTPNEKYNMEAGSNETIRLYIRNDMDDKTVKKVYLEIGPNEYFTYHHEPDYIANIPPEEYKYFDINVTIAENTPTGDYRVDLLVGTDEYMVGSYSDEIMIRIRTYNNELFYVFIAIVTIIIAAVMIRFIWIIRVNKKNRIKYKKKKHAISDYYYKKNVKPSKK